uniref:Uncharacterized protein n=1 Tax=Vitis vinifera TaxID=29760 RepID=A5BZN2_VITVI|nr:hypothetical protein VITISV_013202 [Vitis vinifera]
MANKTIGGCIRTPRPDALFASCARTGGHLKFKQSFSLRSSSRGDVINSTQGHPTELEGVLFVVDAHTIAILTGVAIARSGLCMAICSLNSSTGGGRSSSIALLAFMASHSYQELNLRNEIPPNNTNETTKFP